MNELDRLLYQAAEQNTRSLPLDRIYARILAEGGEKATEPAQEPVEVPAPKAFPRRRPIRSLVAIAAAGLIALVTYPAFTEQVTVDGQSYTAFAGRVNVGGVIYNINEPAADIIRDPRSGEYRILTPAPAASPASSPGPSPSPTPSHAPSSLSTPAPSLTPIVVREEEPRPMIANRKVELHTGPGEGYPVAGQMFTNDTAWRTGITADGWARLTWEGETVYAHMDGFTFASTTGVSYPDVVMEAVEETDVYTLPSMGEDSSVCGHLNPGDRVTANRPYGDWIRIEWEGERAYVLYACLKAAPEGEESTGTLTVGDKQYFLGNPDTGETWSGKQIAPVEVYGETDVLLYAGPGTGYAVVGDLYPGRKATQVGISGDWAILLWNGRLCYGEAKLLKAAPLNNVRYPSVEKYVIDTARVWPIPREEGLNLGTLLPGDIVTAVGSIGQWAVIEYNGAKGYVLQTALANEWEIEGRPEPVEVPEIPEAPDETPPPLPSPAAGELPDFQSPS